jgi:hypothetical protein
MELYIIQAEADPQAQEVTIEVGVVAGSSDQAIQLASRYCLPKKDYCFQCEETNVAVDPPARVIGWFDHGTFVAAEVQTIQDVRENTLVLPFH